MADETNQDCAYFQNGRLYSGDLCEFAYEVTNRITKTTTVEEFENLVAKSSKFNAKTGEYKHFKIQCGGKFNVSL
jgi:hypothetical protein